MNGEYDELDFSQAQDLLKKRQRYFRRPKKPADLLARLMARKGYAQTQSSNNLEDIWNQVVGPKWQAKTKVGNVSRGILEVYVVSAAVNQQLGFQKRKLLADLKNRLPQNKLKDIRFRIGNVK